MRPDEPTSCGTALRFDRVSCVPRRAARISVSTVHAPQCSSDSDREARYTFDIMNGRSARRPGPEDHAASCGLSFLLGLFGVLDAFAFVVPNECKFAGRVGPELPLKDTHQAVIFGARFAGLRPACRGGCRCGDVWVSKTVGGERQARYRQGAARTHRSWDRDRLTHSCIQYRSSNRGGPS